MPSVKRGRGQEDDADWHDELRKRAFAKLLEALRPSANGIDFPHRAFATSEVIKPSQDFTLRSFHVEGAGDLRLPLSAEDVSELRDVCQRRSFGSGVAALLDPTIGNCWEANASKVSFPGEPTFLSETVQTLAKKSAGALGLDCEGMELEAHLYKLLLDDAGANFTFQKDIGTGKGVVAMLLLQLPTEEGYKGGKLVVKHNNEVEELDCRMVSAVAFSYSVILADCRQMLRKITSGSKVCLAFRLVKRGFCLDRGRRTFISRQVWKAEVALEPWRDEVMKRQLKVFGRKLAITLEHKYTVKSLSFAGLKGSDRIVAEILQNCWDTNSNEPWLDLHLCLVTQSQFGGSSLCDDCDGDCCLEEHHFMTDFSEGEITVDHMVKLDGTSGPVDYEKLCLDSEKEVVCEQEHPFNSEPDKVEFDPCPEYPCIEYFSTRAMLLAWPVALSISIACERDISGALDIVEKTLEDKDFEDQLRQIICYCEQNVHRVWGHNTRFDEDLVTPRLVSLCARDDMLVDTLRVLRLLLTPHVDMFIHSKSDLETPFRIGLKNAAAGNAVALAVHVHGWEMLSSVVTELTRECAFTQFDSFVHLVDELKRSGNEYAARLVAQTAFKAFHTRPAKSQNSAPAP